MGGRARGSPPAQTVCLLLIGLGTLWLYRMRGGPDRCDMDSYGIDTLELDLKRCDLHTLPASISRFQRLIKLDLGFNKLATLPQLPPHLETLFLIGNAFEAIPPTVSTLSHLRMLSFKSCKLSAVDQPLPVSLKWLILTDNVLTELPAQLGDLTGMRKLMLSNNRLASLPRALASMRELELLRLANNQLRRVPPWLVALPRLAWLALAGNPCIDEAPPRAALASVRYEDVILGARLGEGTAGNVHRGTWRGQTVAVKLYKAALNSDGRSIDEGAWLAA